MSELLTQQQLDQLKRFWMHPGKTMPITVDVVTNASKTISALFEMYSTALSRESAYREALEEIAKTYGGEVIMRNIARQALDRKPEEPVGWDEERKTCWNRLEVKG